MLKASPPEFFLLASGVSSKKLLESFLRQPYLAFEGIEGELIFHPERGDIALFGKFSPATIARLKHLRTWLPSAFNSAQWYDYAAVENSVERLSESLRKKFGDELKSFDWVGVPRGGLITLGLLSYALNIDAERLHNFVVGKGNRPLVVVDDCALTGNRFSRFIEETEAPEIIFAHLCSPKMLRRAITAGAPVVRSCIAADNLPSLAISGHTSNDAAWKTKVASNLGDKRYWLGKVRSPVFPWSEPDHNFWNPVTEEMEWGWQLAYPENCLKHRFRDCPQIEVFEIPYTTGFYELTESTLYCPVEDRVFIFDYEDRTQHMLESTGSALWHLYLSKSSMEEVVNCMVDMFDVAYNRALLDATKLAQELIDRGFLRPRNEIGSFVTNA